MRLSEHSVHTCRHCGDRIRFLGAGLYTGSDGRNGCPKRPTNQFQINEPHEPGTVEEAAWRVHAFLVARQPLGDDLQAPTEVLRMTTVGPDAVLLTADLEQLVQSVLPTVPAPSEDQPPEWMTSPFWVCSHLIIWGQSEKYMGTTYERMACRRLANLNRLMPEPPGIDTTDRCLPCRRRAAELGVNGEE